MRPRFKNELRALAALTICSFMLCVGARGAHAAPADHPDWHSARVFGQVMCQVLPNVVSAPGDTFSDFRCRPLRYDRLVGDWLYSVWTTERHRGEAKYWYAVLTPDFMVLEKIVNCRFPSTCGLLG